MARHGMAPRLRLGLVLNDFVAGDAGSDGWDLQVHDLARTVAEEIPGTRVTVNHGAPPDRRSFRVDVALFRQLAPGHQPRMTRPATIRALRDGLLATGLADRDFRNSSRIRLRMLEALMRAGRLDDDLRWTAPAESSRQRTN